MYYFVGCICIEAIKPLQSMRRERSRWRIESTFANAKANRHIKCRYLIYDCISIPVNSSLNIKSSEPSHFASRSVS